MTSMSISYKHMKSKFWTTIIVKLWPTKFVMLLASTCTSIMCVWIWYGTIRHTNHYWIKMMYKTFWNWILLSLFVPLECRMGNMVPHSCFKNIQYINVQMVMEYWSLLVSCVFLSMNKDCIYVPIFMSCVDI
jgi:hypothetical protein